MQNLLLLLYFKFHFTFTYFVIKFKRSHVLFKHDRAFSPLFFSPPDKRKTPLFTHKQTLLFDRFPSSSLK